MGNKFPKNEKVYTLFERQEGPNRINHPEPKVSTVIEKPAFTQSKVCNFLPPRGSVFPTILVFYYTSWHVIWLHQKKNLKYQKVMNMPTFAQFLQTITGQAFEAGLIKAKFNFRRKVNESSEGNNDFFSGEYVLGNFRSFGRVGLAY